MLRLSILSARGRLGTFTGALIALFAASVLAMAWGMQLESMLRTHPPVERYAGATAVVAGQQNVGADHDVQLTERARVEHRAHRSPGRAARRPGRDRRRVGACPARRPRRRCSWVVKRRAHPLRAERRTPTRPTRRGSHRLSRRARRAAAPRIDHAHAHGHRGRRRSPPPSRHPAERDLPDRRRDNPRWPATPDESTRSACSPGPALTSPACALPLREHRCSPALPAGRANTPSSRRPAPLLSRSQRRSADSRCSSRCSSWPAR